MLQNSLTKREKYIFVAKHGIAYVKTLYGPKEQIMTYEVPQATKKISSILNLNSLVLLVSYQHLTSGSRGQDLK